MPEPLSVPTHLLSASGRDTVDHAHDAFRQFNAHDNDLAEASARWVGSSATALSELAERWQTRHATHLEQTRALGEHLTDAAVAYVTADDTTGADVTRAADAIAPDMGI